MQNPDPGSKRCATVGVCPIPAGLDLSRVVGRAECELGRRATNFGTRTVHRLKDHPLITVSIARPAPLSWADPLTLRHRLRSVRLQRWFPPHAALVSVQGVEPFATWSHPQWSSTSRRDA